MGQSHLPRAVRQVLRAMPLSGTSMLAAVLTPKCPLCAAAWLSTLGLGGSLAGQLAPWMRPLLLAAAGLAFSLAVGPWVWLRFRAQRRLGCCRQPTPDQLAARGRGSAR